jgi:TonB family protein
MEHELELRSWPQRARRAIPKALVCSLVLHGVLMTLFATRPEWLFPREPPPEPEPIPVVFVPPRHDAHRPKDAMQPALRYEFPDAPESREKVRSRIKSDRDRKAQTQDRSKRTAPSSGGPPVPQEPQPNVQPRPLQPPSAPAPKAPQGPASNEPGAPAQAPTPRYDAAGRTPFEQQFEKMQTGHGRGLLSPPTLERSLPPAGSGGQAGGGPGNDPQGGLLSFDTEADALGPYGRILYDRIKAAWVLPNIAKSFAKGMTEVKFTISRNGTIGNIHVSQSSGWPPLDNAAVNAVRGAAPMPPLPDSFPGEQVGVTFRFYVNVPIPPA